MRKPICFVCIMCMTLTLAACGRKDAGTGTDPQSAAVTSSVNNTLFQSDQSADMDQDQSVEEKNIDLSNDFNGIRGCAVLYFPENNHYYYYNRSICEQRVSPFSTFKIISALAGLENGVIQNESSVMNYNGTQYPVTEWNQNLTLKEAFQSSCIWYFRQVTDAVGEAGIQEILNDLQYGNCDISEWEGSGINPSDELNGFWLDSSLKISPEEQVRVLSDIFGEESEFAPSEIKILKNIMLVSDDDNKKIYGKTGSGTNGEAWFVDFSEENNVRKYIAIYLSDYEKRSDISGGTARDIALKIISAF